MFRVRIGDLELTAEEILFPFELRSFEVRHALRIDEDLDILLCDNEVRRPRRVRHVHPILHAAAATRDDPQTEGPLGLALLLPENADSAHRAVGDLERQRLRSHHLTRVPMRSNAGPRLKSSAASRIPGRPFSLFNSLTTKDIYNDVIVSSEASPKLGGPDHGIEERTPGTDGQAGVQVRIHLRYRRGDGPEGPQRGRRPAHLA